MYTGTLIRDLLQAVETAEYFARISQLAKTVAEQDAHELNLVEFKENALEAEQFA
jgi:hypothetical protein